MKQPLPAWAEELIAAALAAADPRRAVRRSLRLEGEILAVGQARYDLEKVGRLVVVGAGKAGAGMAVAVEEVLGGRISAGLVNRPHGVAPPQPLRRIRLQPAAHPLPDRAGLAGTERICALLEGLTERDLALVLLSGGASAMLTRPAAEISLDDLRRLTDLLLHSGATIQEVNAVRKHISQIKGGQLARRTHARLLVLLLSDVVGSPLDAIGSGPCAPDPTTFADAWDVMERYDLFEQVPVAVRKHLLQGLHGEIAETPKPGDPLFARVHHQIVADNRSAALAVVERARALGLQAELLTSYLEGEAREVGRVVAALAREEALHGRPLPRPACLVLGGETTVTVRGDGQGGRNQELALAAALALAGLEGVVVVSLATDGVDGPTDAAGAVVDGRTVARARTLGLDPAAHLARNDAYPLLDAVGALIRTGPTGTNVNDLVMVLVEGGRGARKDSAEAGRGHPLSYGDHRPVRSAPLAPWDGAPLPGAGDVAGWCSRVGNCVRPAAPRPFAAALPLRPGAARSPQSPERAGAGGWGGSGTRGGTGCPRTRGDPAVR